MAGKKISGHIRRLCDERPGRKGGFGFIRVDDGKDYFFHLTELIDVTFSMLHVGDQMSFVPVETPEGLRANEVERVQAYGGQH
jgi:cold shock CspA family protein